MDLCSGRCKDVADYHALLLWVLKDYAAAALQQICIPSQSAISAGLSEPSISTVTSLVSR